MSKHDSVDDSVDRLDTLQDLQRGAEHQGLDLQHLIPSPPFHISNM